MRFEICASAAAPQRLEPNYRDNHDGHSLTARTPRCYQIVVPRCIARVLRTERPCDTSRGVRRCSTPTTPCSNSKEVARLLDLSPDTVNELARKSVLPAFKKGRQWRFRKRDITSFKRQLRGTTAA